MGFSGSRWGLAGFGGAWRGFGGATSSPHEAISTCKESSSLIDFEQTTPNPFEQIMLVLHFQWFLPFSIHQHNIIDTCNPKSFGSLRVLRICLSAVALLALQISRQRTLAQLRFCFRSIPVELIIKHCFGISELTLYFQCFDNTFVWTNDSFHVNYKAFLTL